MPTLNERIRRARTLARFSQQELAEAVGVQRSAVAQWERPQGSRPSMHHLLSIAEVCGVHLEWLGTGRGAVRLDASTAAAVRTDDYAQDDLEAECLNALRKLPFQLRKQLVATIVAVAHHH
jgi:transcriptional regulator with XRE-family HTH domain